MQYANRARLREQEDLVVAHAENLSRYAVRLFGAQVHRERRDLLRRHLLETLDTQLLGLRFGGNRADHAAPRGWRDGVGADIVACHVERDAAREAVDAELCRHVVGLAEI